MGETHTGPSLLYFLRDNPKDSDDFNHDLDDDVFHGCCRLNLYVGLKSLEEAFHAAK